MMNQERSDTGEKKYHDLTTLKLTLYYYYYMLDDRVTPYNMNRIKIMRCQRPM